MNWLLTLLLAGAVTSTPDYMIVEFTKNDCGPCKQLQPTLEQLKREGVTVRSVDVDVEPLLVRRFAISSVPTLVIIREGREVDRIVGAAPHAKIQERLAKVSGRVHSQPAEFERLAPRGQLSTQPALASPSPGIQLAGSQFAAAPTSDFSVQAQQAVAPNVAAPQSLLQSPPTSQPDDSLTVRGQSPGRNSFPMIASAANATAAVASQVRSELTAIASPAKPTLTLQQAIARAEAATVRIRVDEENSTAYGTGTIIDVHGDEALVLTCGHLFREMKPHSQLTIDLYAGRSQPMNLPAQLIDFRADPGAEDIGLISFKLPLAVEPVALLPKHEQFSIGQAAFSFGCDHGENPTRRDTQIKSINRYIGAANVEIAGAPAVGRSGGGLFDNQGRLIGVCNAADMEDDEGIYAAAQIVYTQIDRLGLSHLFEHMDAQAAPVQLAASNNMSTAPAAATFANFSEPAVTASSLVSPASAERPNQIRWPDETGGATQLQNSPRQPAGFTAQSTTPSTAAGASSAKQMICILRDANGRDQVVTVEAPPAELVDAIHRQASR